MARAPFEINGEHVSAGEHAEIQIPLPGLYTQTTLSMPVHVIHGRRDGPTLFVSAAVHGDEILGVETIRRLLLQPRLKSLRGTLLAVPIVNVFGFHIRSRYLPDRRDLNRSFPGREHGTLAGRLAYIFLREVVLRANAGIDLHTAAVHRENFPQIRADMKFPGMSALAKAFAAPVLIHSAPPEGALRYAAAADGVPVLTYEASEALRFDEIAIRVALRGIVNVMREMGMLSISRRSQDKPSAVVRTSSWVRAPQSGIVRASAGLGEMVKEGQSLAYLNEAGVHGEEVVNAPFDGIVIGRTTLPLAYEGEALFHLGRPRAEDRSLMAAHIDSMQDGGDFSIPELVEEPEIV